MAAVYLKKVDILFIFGSTASLSARTYTVDETLFLIQDIN